MTRGRVRRVGRVGEGRPVEPRLAVATTRHASPRRRTPPHAAPHRGTPRHAAPRPHTPPHGAPHRRTPRHAAPRPHTPPHAAPRRLTLPHAARGFTLLELVVVIAVIGILAAALAPSVIQQVVDARIEETREELAAIHAGMVGDPGQNDFGFVGHVGRLPSSLQELVAPGGLPGYTTETARAIGIGWRGPYVNIGASATDFLLDGFGRPYVLSGGQVQSAGPDGVPGTGDDLVYPPAAPRIGGDVTVTLRRTQGNRIIVDPTGYRVDLYYPSDGRQEVLSDYDAPFSFTNVPVGPRAIQVVKVGNPDAGEILGEDTVVVRPGSTMAAELWF